MNRKFIYTIRARVLGSQDKLDKGARVNNLLWATAASLVTRPFRRTLD